MSVRKLIVQYVGDVLLLPKLERDVMRIYERDRIGRTVSEYVPIVRCKDCKFCVKRGYRLYCDLNAGGFPEVEPDGFCAWGEQVEQ